MGKISHIEWCDATVNFWQGCIKVSEGCKNCYMYRDKKRYGQDPMKIIRSSDKTFYDALKWKESKRIFTCSWSDFFIEQADEWRKDAWEVIKKTPQHLWIILTKRPERIESALYDMGWMNAVSAIPRNIIIGISPEGNENTASMWPVLECLSRQFRFKTMISFEPLLEQITPFSLDIITGGYCDGIDLRFPDWIITGGESDFKNPRPSEIQWFRNIRDFCIKHDVPYFHKQHGGKVRINGAWGGRELDGMYWNQIPEWN